MEKSEVKPLCGINEDADTEEIKTRIANQEPRALSLDLVVPSAADRGALKAAMRFKPQKPKSGVLMSSVCTWKKHALLPPCGEHPVRRIIHAEAIQR